MKRALSAVSTLCLALVLGLSTISVAGAAQQSITIVPPNSTTLCPLAASIPDNGLTTITTNTDGSCTFAATSSPTSVQGNSVTNTLLSDAALSMIENLKVQGWGDTKSHLVSTLGAGTIPVVSACSTGAVSSTSTDSAFELTSTGATSCVVTFATAFNHKPVCLLSNITHPGTGSIAYTGATAITISGQTAADVIDVSCFGK